MTSEKIDLNILKTQEKEPATVSKKRVKKENLSSQDCGSEKSRLTLKKIELKGFKSIDSDGYTTIPINDDVTVMIGANGSGKSNIVSFFQMLNYAMTDSLQVYIARNGDADTFLHYGSKVTESLAAKLHFTDGNNDDIYSFKLTAATGGASSGKKLIFTEESIKYHIKDNPEPFKHSYEPGSKETQLTEPQNGSHKNVAKVLRYLLSNCRYYQFHDTTLESKIRNSCYINDYKTLKSNGGNLAAFLYNLKEDDNGRWYYNRIILYIRQVLRQFGDFDLKPLIEDKRKITLDWREDGNETVFGVHQFSDGTLRFIALAALLLQPPETMPSVIVIDEPELGLHPKAISVLASMIWQASQYAQVIVATQSPQLLDEFDENNIVVIERDRWKQSTTVKKLDKDRLKSWRERYTLSELWDKNVLGGRP